MNRIERITALIEQLNSGLQESEEVVANALLAVLAGGSRFFSTASPAQPKA